MRIYSTTAAYVASLAQIAIRKHDQLQELADDDHTHYLNVARHDLAARHGLAVLDPLVCSEAEAAALILTHKNLASAHHAKAVSSDMDHGSIGGLADDDHPQYAAIVQAETITGAWKYKTVNGQYVLHLDSYKAHIAYKSALVFRKSQSDSEAYGATTDGSDLGTIAFQGVGTDEDRFDQAVEILVEQDGAAGANFIPGRYVLKIGTDSAAPVGVHRVNKLGAQGFGGANFGTLRQVLESVGSGGVPVWKDQLQYIGIAPTTAVYPTDAATWENYDLSSDVPANAKFAEIMIWNTDAANAWDGGVRKNGSAIVRKFTVGKESQVILTVELDANRVCDYYSERAGVNGEVQFRCVGYWT